jgi:hypothetical protein
MDVVLWVVAGLLTVTFLFSGATKLLQTREQLIASGLALYTGWPPPAIKALGVIEVLGAIGLILPQIVEEQYGASFERPARYAREYLGILLPLLRREAVEYRGRC